MTDTTPRHQIWMQRLATVGALAVLPSIVFAGFSQTQTINGYAVTDSVNVAGLFSVVVALLLVTPLILRHNLLERLDATPTPAFARAGGVLLALLCLGQGAASLGLLPGDALASGMQMAMLRFGLV